MMGKPQPLNTLVQQPSFEQSTTSAIRIQSVLLFCMQQFIRNLLCFHRGRYVEIF